MHLDGLDCSCLVQIIIICYAVNYSILVAFVVALVTSFLPLPANGSDDLLIATISQGLAAIFTLVFAITIFAAQMMRKFTAMDMMIDIRTKILMIIFAIGIILPLTCL